METPPCPPLFPICVAEWELHGFLIYCLGRQLELDCAQPDLLCAFLILRSQNGWKLLGLIWLKNKGIPSFHPGDMNRTVVDDPECDDVTPVTSQPAFSLNVIRSQIMVYDCRIVKSWTVGNVLCFWWYAHVLLCTNKSVWICIRLCCCIFTYCTTYFTSPQRWELKLMTQPCCQ